MHNKTIITLLNLQVRLVADTPPITCQMQQNILETTVISSKLRIPKLYSRSSTNMQINLLLAKELKETYTRRLAKVEQMACSALNIARRQMNERVRI
jgi:hypothetical protein